MLQLWGGGRCVLAQKHPFQSATGVGRIIIIKLKYPQARVRQILIIIK